MCHWSHIHPNTSGVHILSFPPSLLLAAGCGGHCGAKSTTGVIEIEITDVNEPPSLSTTAANVDENLDIGTLVKVRRGAHSILITPFIHLYSRMYTYEHPLYVYIYHIYTLTHL